LSTGVGGETIGTEAAFSIIISERGGGTFLDQGIVGSSVDLKRVGATEGAGTGTAASSSTISGFPTNSTGSSLPTVIGFEIETFFDGVEALYAWQEHES
jgi:hypothetical protein